MMSRLQSCEEGESAASEHENPTRTSKLPSEKVVLLVLGSLLAAALVVIYRLSLHVIQTNRTVQTLKEEIEALRKTLSETSPCPVLDYIPCPLCPHSCAFPQPVCPPSPCPTIKHKGLKCEAGWEQHGGNCYKFNTRKSSWNDSRDSCKDLGGDLVKIDSREEQMFLEFRLGELMMENYDKFWIGLTDSEEEDRWLWVDGSPLVASLAFWASRPDNRSMLGQEEADCVTMGDKTGADDLKTWFDSSCDVPHKSICDKVAEMGWIDCV